MTAQTARIMILDDEQDLAEGLAEMLRLRGYAVDIAADVAEALDNARHRRFDIAFVDSNLPDADGADVGIDLKRIMPEARVVMMTGSRDPASLRPAILAGAEGPLLKPFSIKEMLQFMPPPG
jgi:two-component system, OmpR family, KDP operon response regulator KdpE